MFLTARLPGLQEKARLVVAAKKDFRLGIVVLLLLLEHEQQAVASTRAALVVAPRFRLP